MSAAGVLNALPAGYTLHEYRIEAMLGVGGFGLTYLAYDGNLNTQVAIKEYLPADFAVRAEDQTVQPKSATVEQSFQWGLRRFLEESRTLASFRHPNIVRVMRFFEANQTAYMVMEFIAGKPLNEWIRAVGMQNQATLARIAAPLLDGLEVIHRAGYLHRDIKPPNIFIREDGSPVLIDFGSARMHADSNQELTSIVSPGFAPFEQYHAHGKQGPWTDIYSLGGVLYWLVTGQKPVEAAARVREDIMPAASALADRTRYSVDFLGAIDWALKPHEQERPQSVAAFRQALVAHRAAGETPVFAATVLTGMPGVVAFDGDTLKRMEMELAMQVGPIAGILARSHAKKAPSLTALVQTLAAEIADDKSRAAFIRKFAGGEHSIPPSQPPRNTAGGPVSGAPADRTSLTGAQRFSAETLQRAEAALAQHIGGIAKVIVKRAAQKARDESELFLLLADEIADKTEKKNFIRQAISSAGKG